MKASTGLGAAGSVAVEPFLLLANRERLASKEGLADRGRLLAGIDAIFFAASATQHFEHETARQAFRERWLGRYIERFPECVFLALDTGGEVAGYIVGALADPAADPAFADISYFRELAALTARFPAHLHINLAAHARNQGLGGRLIEAFCEHARTQGAPGVHAVTAEQSRNRSFYARHGFAPEAATSWNGHAIVFLARRL